MTYQIEKIHKQFVENVNDSGMIKIICVAYEREVELGVLIECFRLQTSKNWELNIVYDGKIPVWYRKLCKKYIEDKRIKFFNSSKRNGCYGHPNRRGMLVSMQPSERNYILMTNDDNYYVPRFIEYMLKECVQGVGMVYCNTVHSHFDYRLHLSELRVKGIDMGAFMVRADIAKEVGFKSDLFEADGIYAVQCKKLCDMKGLRTVWVQKPLFVHN